MGKKATSDSAAIPQYVLKGFRGLHRQEDDTTDFGYNNLDTIHPIAGFELYSSRGLKPSLGPLKSAFYRISITITGQVDMQLGLEHFKHQPRTMSFTWPNQVFSKSNISADAFGYYLLFNEDFLNDLVPAANIPREFPFFDYSGKPLFQLAPEEIDRVQQFVLNMNEELKANRPGKEKAVRMYLYLLLLEAKRSYERQQLHVSADTGDTVYLVSHFQKLVSRHFLLKRKVTDYASLLAVSANHLNRTVKDVTGKTASESIADMLVQEAKAVLKYTEATVSEIAYQLNFSEPAAFNRFFKKMTGETPLYFRKNALGQYNA
ncbi:MULTISPECIES: helix-turn-helix domain-containing protein [Niastella]|uniref:Helix-turn-helix domain-containing protein n=1 Tax=Niastella soli TaxID=2821487 RepID=A0ABS3YWK6_9BACT|nr:helix-turn-helix domain-containing protein [Niastella soli]MBO9202209.1 helix-turn-helix domain-containing protein [Niastella soli]